MTIIVEYQLLKVLEQNDIGNEFRTIFYNVQIMGYQNYTSRISQDVSAIAVRKSCNCFLPVDSVFIDARLVGFCRSGFILFLSHAKQLNQNCNFHTLLREVLQMSQKHIKRGSWYFVTCLFVERQIVHEIHIRMGAQEGMLQGYTILCIPKLKRSKRLPVRFLLTHLV